MDKLSGSTTRRRFPHEPFSPRELIARLRALLRRAQNERAEGAIEVGALRIDTLAREVTFKGRPLSLTPREFELLAFLAHRPGRVMSREELLRKVWGYDYLGETRTVDVHVRRLRVKLGEKNRMIETVTRRLTDVRVARRHSTTRGEPLDAVAASAHVRLKLIVWWRRCARGVLTARESRVAGAASSTLRARAAFLARSRDPDVRERWRRRRKSSVRCGYA